MCEMILSLHDNRSVIGSVQCPTRWYHRWPAVGALHTLTHTQPTTCHQSECTTWRGARSPERCRQFHWPRPMAPPSPPSLPPSSVSRSFSGRNCAALEQIYFNTRHDIWTKNIFIFFYQGAKTKNTKRERERKREREKLGFCSAFWLMCSSATRGRWRHM